jgi:hypothetical protein
MHSFENFLCINGPQIRRFSQIKFHDNLGNRNRNEQGNFQENIAFPCGLKIIIFGKQPFLNYSLP